MSRNEVRTSPEVRTLRAELVLAPTADFGEGPMWDDRDGTVWWTDIPGRSVHQLDPRAMADRTVATELTVGAIVPRAGGGLVAACENGFGELAADGSIDVFAEVDADRPDMRMNDGKCDSAGRFYASSMAYAATERVGSLYRLDADRSVQVVDSGLTIGNGLAWSADGRLLYFIDTMSCGVDVFDVDLATGDLRSKRRAFDIAPEHGLPDGMCIDDEGGLWVAMWQGGALRRYAPDGTLLAVVELPVTNVTCASFVGPDLDELYITTAAPRHAGLTRAEPLSGGIFSVRPGVSGPPPAPYKG